MKTIFTITTTTTTLLPHYPTTPIPLYPTTHLITIYLIICKFTLHATRGVANDNFTIVVNPSGISVNIMNTGGHFIESVVLIVSDGRGGGGMGSGGVGWQLVWVRRI